MLVGLRSIGVGQIGTGIRPWCPHSELIGDSFTEVYSVMLRPRHENVEQHGN